MVGLPLHLDGERARAQKQPVSSRARSKSRLAPVALVDERLTTSLAERAPLESPRGRRQRKQHLDALAAALILRTYLERPREEYG